MSIQSCQVLKGEFYASSPDIKFLSDGWQISVEPSSELVLVDEKFVDRNRRSGFKQPIIRIVTMRQVEVLAHEMWRCMAIRRDLFNWDV